MLRSMGTLKLQDWALQDWTMTDECVGIRGVIPEEEKEGSGGKDLQKRKVLSLEWTSEGVMQY